MIMNLFKRYLIVEKMVKAFILLDKLLKWLFWCALSCSLIWYVFSLDKRFLCYIITGGISVLWLTIRIVQSDRIEKLNEIDFIGSKDKDFRNCMIEKYERRLSMLSKRFQKKPSPKLERQKEDLLYLIAYYKRSDFK